MGITSDFLVERIQKNGWLSVGNIYFDNGLNWNPFTTGGYICLSPSKELIISDGKYDSTNSAKLDNFLIWNSHRYINMWQTITVVGFDMLQHFDINLFQGEQFYNINEKEYYLPDVPTPDEIKAIQLDPDTGLADETQYSIGETLDKQKWSCIEAFPDAPWDQAVGFRIKVWQDFYKEHEKFCNAMNTFLGVSDCI